MRLSGLLLLLLSLLALPGAGLLVSTGEAALPPLRGGSLRIGVSHPLHTADPALAANAGERQTAGLVTEALFDSDGQNLTGRLVLSFREEEEGRLLRIQLKPGLRFHDGSLLRAEDVRASLLRLIAGGERFPAARRLLPIQGATPVYGLASAQSLRGVEVLSPLELTIRFETATPGFGHTLADPAFGILPAARMHATARPVGTGPFVLESLSPTRAVLRAFPDHHGGRPYLEQVTLLAGGNSREERRIWEASQVDGLLYPRIPVEATGHLSAVTGFAVLLVPDPALPPARRQTLTRLAQALVPCRQLAELFESRRMAPFPGEAPRGPTVRGPDAQLAAFTEVMRRSVGESCIGFAQDAEAARRLHREADITGTLVLRVRADHTELVLIAQRLELLARQEAIPLKVEALEPGAFFEKRGDGGWHWELVEAPLVALDGPAPAFADVCPLYRLMPRVDWRDEAPGGVRFTRFGILDLADSHRRRP